MTRRPAKGISAAAFMAGFSTAGRSIHRDLDEPNGSKHPRAIENGTVSTAFPVCLTCEESTAMAGHDDASCFRCERDYCSAALESAGRCEGLVCHDCALEIEDAVLDGGRF